MLVSVVCCADAGLHYWLITRSEEYEYVLGPGWAAAPKKKLFFLSFLPSLTSSTYSCGCTNVVAPVRTQ